MTKHPKAQVTTKHPKTQVIPLDRVTCLGRKLHFNLRGWVLALLYVQANEPFYFQVGKRLEGRVDTTLYTSTKDDCFLVCKIGPMVRPIWCVWMGGIICFPVINGKKCLEPLLWRTVHIQPMFF